MGIGSARNGDLRIIAWHYPVTQNFEQPERLFLGHVAVVKGQQLTMISCEPRLAFVPPHSAPYINNLERSENKSQVEKRALSALRLVWISDPSPRCGPTLRRRY